MRNIISILALLLFPLIGFSQGSIVGKFTSEQVNIAIGQQQVAQQGSWGSTISVGRSYLTVNGRKYSLYRYSKEEVQAMHKPGNGQQQQVQQAVSVIVQDYFLLGYQNENEKYCQIKGDIDEENGIIYNASLIKSYNSNEITEALNKCGTKL